MFLYRCSETVPTLTPDDFEKHLRETLDEVQKRPKVFVNLVLAGNLSGVSPVQADRQIHQLNGNSTCLHTCTSVV